MTPTNDDDRRAAAEFLCPAERRGMERAAGIADKWRDENKASAAKARSRERKFDALALDHPGMAEMLEGAAIECNAIAAAIRAEITKGADHDRV